MASITDLPDVPMDQDEMPPEAEGPSEQLQIELVDAVHRVLRSEKWACRQETMEARLQRYYERGDQNLYYDRSSYQYRPLADSGQNLPNYTDVYNIFRPNLRTIVSIMSQNTPGNDMKPVSLKVSADINSATLAEKMRPRMYREIGMQEKQTDIARFFCTDSRTVSWTRIVEGKVVCTIYGVLETKVPIYLKGGKDRWPYLVISEEIDLETAKDDYDNDDIENSEDSEGEESYRRYARLGVLSGTRSAAVGDVQKSLVTRHTAWLRKSRYRKMTAASRDEAMRLFPDGVQVTVCGGIFCGAIAPDWDELSIEFPAPGDGQNRPSLLKDLVALQDAFNDGMNQAREYFDYGIPATWFNEEAVDTEALGVQRSEPAAMHPATGNNGQPLSDMFWQEAPAVLPPGLMEYLQNISGQLAQVITGNLPSVSGMEAPTLETAQAYAQARDSAMGQYSMAWGAMKRICADITRTGIMKMAQLIGEDEITIEGEYGTTDSFQASDVLIGSFGCYPDTDSSFPETTASKRAAYTQFVTQLGQVEGGIQIIGQPDNLKLGLELSGMEDFVIPGAEARDKQLREIEELLNSEPRPVQVDPTQPVDPNAPPQLESSVKVDPDFDYHQAEFDKVQQWLSSEDRVREERKGNVLGIQNVRLHGLAHKAILDKQAADAAQAAAAANAPPPPSPPMPKPPSISFKGEDLTPDEQAQALAMANIKADPEVIAENQGAKAAQDALPHILAHQQAAEQDFAHRQDAKEAAKNESKKESK
jgi:hypothetical protein